MKKLFFTTGTVTALILLLAPSHFSQYPDKPKSRLGVQGEMGFIVTAIQPGSTAEQAGLKSGDIITSTSLSGQVTNGEQFQKDIAASAPGTTIQITYLRFNSATGSFDERAATVKTMPILSQSQSSASSIPAQLKRSLSAPSSQITCYWCCEACTGLEPYQQACTTLTRETGKINCRLRNGRCEFTYCL